MIKNSAIEWTGPTWNCWQGCKKKSPGCKNCYMYRDKRRYGQEPSVVVRSKPNTFNKPLKLQKEVNQGKRIAYQDKLVFTCSWSDFFNPEADKWRLEAWEIIRQCPDLIFQILTKLPERINDHLPPFWNEIKDRCWIGTSIENQDYLHRIDYLEQTDVSLRFLSLEPLLGPIPNLYLSDIDWVIVGGESGPNARPMDERWVRQIKDQCIAYVIPFFYKQRINNGKKISCPELDGKQWMEMPKEIVKSERREDLINKGYKL